VSQQINLYSPIFRRQEKKFSARAMLQAGGLILFGVVLLAALNAWKLTSLRAEIRSAGQQQAMALQQLEETRRKLKPRVGDPRLEEEVGKLEAVLILSSRSQDLLRRDVFNESRGYSSYFVAFARQSLPELRLTGVDITGAGKSMQLSGRTTMPERVPQYLQRLSSEKFLSGTEFQAFRIERPDEKSDRPPAALPAKKPKPADHVEFVIRTAEPATKGGKS